MTEVCRRAINGVAKPDLEDDLFALLPVNYRGYLVPARSEPQAPDGTRALVCLADDLVTALGHRVPPTDFAHGRSARDDVRDAYLEEGPSDREIRDDITLRIQRRALVLALGIEHHPPGYDEAIRRAHDDFERGAPAREGTRRKLLDEAYMSWFDEGVLPPRPTRRSPVPRRVGLAGIEAVDDWLRRRRFYSPGRRLFAGWEADRNKAVPRLVLLLTALQRAAARFAEADVDPMLDWYSEHADKPLLRPERCRYCPTGPTSPDCPCKQRMMDVATGHKGRSGRAGRQRNRVAMGQAAVELAAWAVVHVHPQDWMDRGELDWVLTRYPIRQKATDVDVPPGLAGLGSLLADEPPTDKTLRELSTLIDDTADPVMLRDIARLGRAVFIRHRGEAHRALAPEFALLGRTLAGALRELRSPDFSAFQWQLATSAASHHPKALEALQDLQLAEQRLRRWVTAAYAYEVALDRLTERYGTAMTQKRSEIEEQLHLGRLGGLVLEAEWLLFEQRRLNDRLRRRIMLLLDHAIQLGSADGRLQRALRSIEAAKAQRASPEDELMHGVLRHTPLWDVMPQIMLSRAHVARAAARLECGAPGVSEDLASAGDIHSMLTARSDLTRRHRWELMRVQLTAAIVEAELDAVAHLVDEVVRAGGDDAGDYTSLAAKWRARTLQRTRAEAVLQDAATELGGPKLIVPRLPDLEAAPLVRGSRST